jgi:hypothetical protein
MPRQLRDVRSTLANVLAYHAEQSANGPFPAE